MARIHFNVKAQQRYATVPVIDPETGQQAQTVVMDKRTGQPKVTKKGKPVVMKRTRADKSQPLPEYSCGACGGLILVGTLYKHVSIKSGPYGGRTLRRHQTCPTWRQSELTTSKMAGIYAAQEEFGDFLETDFTDASEVTDALSAAAEQIREVAEEYRESAEAIRDGFGHDTYQSEELDEKADELETWADEVENADVPGEPEEEDDEEDQEDDEDDDEGPMEDWRDEVRETVTIVDECPV